ncbi:MAG: hypothetical protein JXB88_09860 [Spirochaetales bacterium]|nr:hypothetical protein [Spirochaetales bacterium]
MKYLSILLVVILFLSFTSCGKQSSNTDNLANTESAKITKDDPVKNILEANKLKKLVTIKNPNTMKLDTTPRDAAVIKEEKKVFEQVAEKFLKYIADHSLDAALEEINKSSDGVFKSDLINVHFYLAILKKTGDQVDTIVAHATSRDFIGVEIKLNEWQDLTGWKYMNAISELSSETNRVWIDDVYWKDPNWVNGKPARFSGYNRFYNINNDRYWLHYTVWLDK